MCARREDSSYCDDRFVVNPAGVCLQHGSFAVPNRGSDARSGIFRFAFVRDPLDRFLSTFRPDHKYLLQASSSNRIVVQKKEASETATLTNSVRTHFAAGYDPHGSWSGCTERTCSGEIMGLRHVAKHLEYELRAWASGSLGPDRRPQHGLLTHALSQMYFLSGTDATGNMLRLDFVGRLETFRADWAAVEQHIGPSRLHERVSTSDRKNVGSLDASIREAVERDPEIMCPVCRIYAQDFQCLGYAMPAICERGDGEACRNA